MVNAVNVVSRQLMVECVLSQKVFFFGLKILSAGLPLFWAAGLKTENPQRLKQEIYFSIEQALQA